MSPDRPLQLYELFDAALNLEQGPERDKYVDEISVKDPSLAEQLKRLLANCSASAESGRSHRSG